jgi:hypothetical protein
MKDSAVSANSYRLSRTWHLHTLITGKCVAVFQESAMSSRKEFSSLPTLHNSRKSAIRKLVITAAASAAALLGTGAAQAGPEQALNSCIEQFIATNMAGYDGKMTVRKDPSEFQPLMLSAPSRYEFSVTAHDKVDGTKLMTATCIAKRDGTVVSLKTEVLSAKVATGVAAKPEVIDAG